MVDSLSFEDIKYRKKEGKIIPRKATLSHEIKKSIYLLVFTLLGIIVLLSIVFLSSTSQSSEKGYILQQEELDRENYLEQSRQLLDKIIQAQTITNLEQKIAGKNMQPAPSPTYIQPATAK